MSSHTSFSSVSELDAQIFMFLHQQPRCLTSTKRGWRGSARLWLLYCERAFQHKRLHSAAHLPPSLHLSIIHFLQGCTGAEEEEERAEREEREKREGRRKGRAREDVGREKSRAEGKPKKKKKLAEMEREEEEEEEEEREVGNENETDGGQERGWKNEGRGRAKKRESG